MKTVVIDPGHGFLDIGSAACDGQYESAFTWQMADALRDALSPYEVAVAMTHEGADTSLAADGKLANELHLRAEVANSLRADLLVSIHHDAAISDKARGGSVYVWTDQEGWLDAVGNHKDLRTYPIAQTAYPFVRDALAELGIPWRRQIMCADFQVLRDTKGPAMLFELFFGTSPDDVAAARKPEFIPVVAKALAKGIAQALTLAERPKPRDPNAVTVLVDSVEVAECEAVLEQEKTRGNLRALAEAMGGAVGYDQRTKTMSVSTKGRHGGN